MKAVVFHGIRDIRLDSVRDPKIKEPTDALIRITASAIDLVELVESGVIDPSDVLTQTEPLTERKAA